MSLNYRQEVTNFCNICEFWHIFYRMREEEDIEGDYDHWCNELYYRHDNKTRTENEVQSKVEAAQDRRKKMQDMLYNDFSGLKKVIIVLSEKPVYICHKEEPKMRMEIVSDTKITYKDVMNTASDLLKFTWKTANIPSKPKPVNYLSIQK